MAIVDTIAKRYGITPGEVVRMSPWDFGLALVCVRQHHEQVAEQMAEAASEGGVPGMIHGIILAHAAMVS